MLEQAACDELLGRLHHALPHLERSPLLIEKCESLLSAYRVALFVPQTHEMRKCDFSDHAFSVFLVGHCPTPTGLASLKRKRQGKHTIDRFNPQWVCRFHYDRWNADRARFLADRIGCQMEEL